MPKLLFLSLFLLLVWPSFAQNTNKLSSFSEYYNWVKEKQQEKSDSTATPTFITKNDIVYNCILGKKLPFREVEQTEQRIIELANQPTSSSLEKALLYHSLGNLYTFWDEILSDSLYNRALTLYSKVNDIDGQVFVSGDKVSNAFMGAFEVSKSIDETYENALQLVQKTTFVPSKIRGIQMQLEYTQTSRQVIPAKEMDSLYAFCSQARTMEAIHADLRIAIYATFSSAYWNMGKQSIALELTEKVIEKIDTNAPEYYLALQNMGFMYFSLGRTEEAKQFAYQALSLNKNPTNAADYTNAVIVRFVLSQLYQKQGDLDSALYYSQQANQQTVKQSRFLLNQKRINADKRFQVERKNREIAIARQEELEAKRWSKLAFMVSIVLSLLLLLILVLWFRLKKTTNKLNLLINSRNELITIIAHDLRSPMSMYQGLAENLDFLIQQEDWSRLKMVGKHIDEVGIALDSLLKNILYWGLNKGSDSEISQHGLELTSLMEDIQDSYHPLAQQNEKELVIEINDDGSGSGNEKDITLIIRNLLDNAIKYSVRQEKIQLTLVVKDNFFLCSMDSIPQPDHLEKLKSIVQKVNRREILEISNETMGFGWANIQTILTKNSGKIQLQTLEDKITLTISFSI